MGSAAVTIPPETRVDEATPATTSSQIALSGPNFAQPGERVTYQLSLTNLEAVTRTFEVVIPLPPQLQYLPDSGGDGGVTYDPLQHTLHWQEDIAPGHLSYLLEPAATPLPYIDLATFELPNLCDEWLNAELPCDGVSVSFNLGTGGDAVTLFGQRWHQLTVTEDGLLLAGATPLAGGPTAAAWLPDASLTGPLLAGLWRDNDLTLGGRWHAAILSGLVAGHDVFYVQWHDVPQAANPDVTARHAMALLLDGAGGLDGYLFYLYDNIADPEQQPALGYSIGIQDRLGERGMTYAYAPGVAGIHPPQGFPPAAGSTLQLRPVLFGSNQPYQRALTFQATVMGQVPATLALTALLATDAADPALAYSWDTHYLQLRHLAFMPLVEREGR